MVHRLVVCPYCRGEQGVKRGKTATGIQRYRCQHEECAHQSLLLDPAYQGRLPEIKQQIIELSLNGSGVRDTARVLQSSTATVMQELKKRADPHVGQYSLGQSIIGGHMRGIWFRKPMCRENVIRSRLNASL